MKFITDLAAEWLGSEAQIPQGVTLDSTETDGVEVTRVKINRDGLIKPKGTYITLRPPALNSVYPQKAALQLLQQELTALLGKARRVLVVGLGNREITADCLGPCTTEQIFVTAHLKNNPLISALSLRQVSVLLPNVEQKTGIPALQHTQSVCDVCKPDLLLCIDSLRASALSHIGRTIQLTDSGISPGFGPVFSKQSFGIPVIALGIPTAAKPKESLSEPVTLQSIDLLIHRAASLLSRAVNAALFPTLSDAELFSLLS